MAETIFRKESVKKVSSPEELHDYIKISNPGIWLVLAAAAALLIALLVWAAVGSLDTTVTASGVARDGKLVCYMADASGIMQGQEVTVNGVHGTVTAVSAKPISRDRAQTESGADEYALYCLALPEWSYVVELTLADALTDGTFARAEIVTEQIRPLDYIFG